MNTQYTYKGVVIEILHWENEVNGYRYKKVILQSKEDMEDLIDSIIWAYEKYRSADKVY